MNTAAPDPPVHTPSRDARSQTGQLDVARRVATLCGGIVIGLGIIIGLGDLLGRPIIPAIPSNAYPMSLLTAAMAVMLGLSLVSEAILPGRRWVSITELIAMAGILCVAIGELVAMLLRTGVPDVGLSPLTAMRPVGAITIAFLAGARFLIVAGRWRGLANLLALCISVLGLMIALGMLYGGPLIPGRDWQPVSISSAAVTLIAAIGIVASNGVEVWPTRLFVGPSVSAVLLRWLLPFVALAIILTDLATIQLFSGLSHALGSLVNVTVSLFVAIVVASYLGRHIGHRLDRSYAALRESEQLFSSLFEAAPAGLSVSDPATGELLDINAEFTRIFGYSRLEAIGRTTLDLGFWKDAATRAEHLARVVAAGGGTRDIDLQMRARDGQELTLRSSSIITTIADRRVLISAFVDMTDAQAAERALQLSHQKFATIFRKNPVGLAVSEYDTGRFVDVNPALLKLMHGTSFDQMIGKTSTEIGMVTAADRQRLIIGGLSATGGRHIPVPMVRLDGEPFEAELSLVAYEEDGVRYLLTSVLDVTERNRAERQRREAEQQYRELVEGVRDVIFALTPAGVLTSLNPAFEQITGLPASDWIGRSFIELLHPDDAPRALREFGSALGGTPVDGEPFRIRKAQGGYLSGQINLACRVKDGQVVELIGIGRDVSERERLSAELRQAQKMEAVGRLAGGIAHDFNNLLTVIIGMGQLSLASLEATRPERAEIEEMVKAGQRAADLTRQLLAFSRRQALQPRDLRIGEVLTSMERLLKRMIGEDILLRTETAPDLGLVRADPGQLEQVIANLVVNARDAMPTGGTISMVADNVEVSEEEARLHPGAKAGQFVRLSVADTGTGMSDEVKSHIFEPFFTTKESGKGTGLGLATVFGIVQQSEGFIEVTSAPGHGSRFDIFLPRVEWQGSEVVGEVVTSHPGGGSGSVLVVDDHPQVLELSRRVLSAMGYTVTTAESPGQALALASDAAGPFALLLTDVVMPGMNGVTLANRLREQRPELRVLLISGSNEETLGQHGVPGQSYPLLRKPFTPAELAGKVREVLGA